MDYRIDSNGTQTRVTIAGRLTFSDHGKVRNLIQEMVNSTAKRVVLDLSKLDFVDSSGLGMLLVAREELVQSRKSFVLRGAQGQVKRVLAVAQLDKVFEIED
jgi:anti-anti-sigma factor